jgi:hypothetical protein
MTDHIVEFDVPEEVSAPAPKPNGTAVATRAEAPPPMAVEATPMSMLATALDRGASMDVLEKLMGLQERWEANEARKAFDAAIADAKAEIPPIIKGRTVSYESKGQNGGRTSYRHEDLAGIAKVIDPILSKFGLSYRFRATSNLNEPIRVTCIIAHRRGHSEETTLTAGADGSGSKNSIQAIGSTITYLQRYTLKAALGLSAAADDDGKAADDAEPTPGLITAEQVAELEALAGNNLAAFLVYAKVERLADITAGNFARAKQVLQSKAKAGAK